ncbi:hypothetical protein XELAEV_18045094mg, partial [Xenopus laevis]
MSNSKHRTIKFTSEISATSINFLDVRISIHNNEITTTMFSKPTDRNTLLNPDSFHNPKTIKAIPKEQYIRVRHISSIVKQFQSVADSLTKKFLNGGYRRSDLKPIIQEDMLCPSDSSGAGKQNLFVGTPNRDLSVFKLHFLYSIIKGNTVGHPTKGTPIKLNDYATCESNHVVYMLKCPCGQAYIGQTTRAVKERIKEHRGNIRNFKPGTATDTSASRHFQSSGHNLNQLKWCVLEKGKGHKITKQEYINNGNLGPVRSKTAKVATGAELCIVLEHCHRSESDAFLHKELLHPIRIQEAESIKDDCWILKKEEGRKRITCKYPGPRVRLGQQDIGKKTCGTLTDTAGAPNPMGQGK